MNKIIIWGGSGQAMVLEELLFQSSIKIEAFFDNNINCTSPIPAVPIYYKKVGFEKWLSAIENRNEYYYLVAIGGNNGSSRSEISRMLKEAGLIPFTAIHKTAFVAQNAVIGESAQILARSSVCARVKIGDNCIINTAAGIDHECIIGNNVHIGPGATLAGCVEIEDNVFVGANATILPRIKIGANALVGAGAVVTKNVSANSIVVGNPARIR